ncbi:DUF6412 domain-containing protein [Catenuloplanes indicus]|uniref:Uncharacterized protein n=1 Tax=Catenuloplanes indicus TaxID=137267 RepID=A0AAE3W3L8_9ACTN|nr:DUF6412 domain-containing protein [Catenuloplanes indicus]MDQ0368735.1 hypothetical protein [Catenuloplanes indicus]
MPLTGFLWSLWAWTAAQLTQAAPAGSSPAEMIALAAAGLVAVVLAIHLATGRLCGPGYPAPHRGAAMRVRALNTRTPRLRDPDAAGRSRPRAPAALPSVA